MAKLKKHIELPYGLHGQLLRGNKDSPLDPRTRNYSANVISDFTVGRFTVT